MLRIAVVEDEQPIRDELCGFVRRYAAENGLQVDLTALADGAQLVSGGCTGYDILFLDIEMPGLGGMAAAEQVRAADQDVAIIFVTNMAQYAIRGYAVDALDFVLKPVSYYQFGSKLARAIERVQGRRGGRIAVQTAGGMQVLATGDIYYLETRDRMLYYHTAQGVFPVRASLQGAEKDLLPYHFARCNQCYLVNLQHVRGVQGEFALVGQDRLEISRRQRSAFLAALAGFMGGAL